MIMGMKFVMFIWELFYYDYVFIENFVRYFEGLKSIKFINKFIIGSVSNYF